MDRARVVVKPHTIWLAALAAVLLVVHLVYPSPVWIALLWMVGGLVALGLYWALQVVRHLSIHRELRYGWVHVGDRLEERFALENRGWLPLLWAEVQDHSDLPGYDARRIVSCDGHSRANWTIEATCTRRGVFTLGPWSLHWEDPFGLFSVDFVATEVQAIAVYPPVMRLPEIVLPHGLAVGQFRSRRHGAEALGEASQTRPYQPRDPMRAIHWPSTAHRGSLIVREPDTEISGDLWIVLDLDERAQGGEGEESTEEYGVILAASLADRLLRENRAVGLMANAKTLALVPPARGRGHMRKILRALALVESGEASSLSVVLKRLKGMAGHGTTALVITPSSDAAWIDALLPFTHAGVSPSVVLLDRASFVEGGSTSERAAARGMHIALAQVGIAAHLVPRGYPFQHVVQPERHGHWEFKITPLGRAIAVRRPGGAR